MSSWPLKKRIMFGDEFKNRKLEVNSGRSNELGEISEREDNGLESSESPYHPKNKSYTPESEEGSVCRLEDTAPVLRVKTVSFNLKDPKLLEFQSEPKELGENVLQESAGYPSDPVYSSNEPSPHSQLAYQKSPEKIEKRITKKFELKDGYGTQSLPLDHYIKPHFMSLKGNFDVSESIKKVKIGGDSLPNTHREGANNNKRTRRQYLDHHELSASHVSSINSTSNLFYSYREFSSPQELLTHQPLQVMISRGGVSTREFEYADKVSMTGSEDHFSVYGTMSICSLYQGMQPVPGLEKSKKISFSAGNYWKGFLTNSKKKEIFGLRCRTRAGKEDPVILPDPRIAPSTHIEENNVLKQVDEVSQIRRSILISGLELQPITRNSRDKKLKLYGAKILTYLIGSLKKRETLRHCDPSDQPNQPLPDPFNSSALLKNNKAISIHICEKGSKNSKSKAYKSMMVLDPKNPPQTVSKAGKNPSEALEASRKIKLSFELGSASKSKLLDIINSRKTESPERQRTHSRQLSSDPQKAEQPSGSDDYFLNRIEARLNSTSGQTNTVEGIAARTAFFNIEPRYLAKSLKESPKQLFETPPMSSDCNSAVSVSQKLIKESQTTRAHYVDLGNKLLKNLRKQSRKAREKRKKKKGKEKSTILRKIKNMKISKSKFDDLSRNASRSGQYNSSIDRSLNLTAKERLELVGRSESSRELFNKFKLSFQNQRVLSKKSRDFKMETIKSKTPNALVSPEGSAGAAKQLREKKSEKLINKKKLFKIDSFRKSLEDLTHLPKNMGGNLRGSFESLNIQKRNPKSKKALFNSKEYPKANEKHSEYNSCAAKVSKHATHKPKTASIFSRAKFAKDSSSFSKELLLNFKKKTVSLARDNGKLETSTTTKKVSNLGNGQKFKHRVQKKDFSQTAKVLKSRDFKYSNRIQSSTRDNYSKLTGLKDNDIKLKTGYIAPAGKSKTPNNKKGVKKKKKRADKRSFFGSYIHSAKTGTTGKKGAQTVPSGAKSKPSASSKSKDLHKHRISDKTATFTSAMNTQRNKLIATSVIVSGSILRQSTPLREERATLASGNFVTRKKAGSFLLGQPRGSVGNNAGFGGAKKKAGVLKGKKKQVMSQQPKPNFRKAKMSANSYFSMRKGSDQRAGLQRKPRTTHFTSRNDANS